MYLLYRSLYEETSEIEQKFTLGLSKTSVYFFVILTILAFAFSLFTSPLFWIFAIFGFIYLLSSK